MKGTTTPRFAIRQATAADGSLLAELGARTFRDAFAADNTPENMEAYLQGAFSPNLQQAELAEEGSVVLIAEAGRDKIGYARLRQGGIPGRITGRLPIEVVRFYSTNEWIGKGVGSALMVACLEEAARLGCDVIWLDVWEHNPRAISFYGKWGFRTVGSQPFRLGEDIQTDLLMQRAVNDNEDAR
jgi:diamine N-acetyltransferase